MNMREELTALAHRPKRYRVRWQPRGGHVHVRMFEGAVLGGAKNGDLVFDVMSWPVVRRMFELGGFAVLDEDEGIP